MTIEDLDMETARCDGEEGCDGGVTEIWIVLLSDPGAMWSARPHGFTLCANCVARREWQKVPHQLRVHGFGAGATREAPSGGATGTS